MENFILPTSVDAGYGIDLPRGFASIPPPPAGLGAGTPPPSSSPPPPSSPLPLVVARSVPFGAHELTTGPCRSPSPLATVTTPWNQSSARKQEAERVAGKVSTSTKRRTIVDDDEDEEEEEEEEEKEKKKKKKQKTTTTTKTTKKTTTKMKTKTTTTKAPKSEKRPSGSIKDFFKKG